MSSDWLRERLAATRLPDDPLDVAMPAGSGDWPEEVRQRLPRALRPAGVLIPIMERGGDQSVLLTQRSAALRYHAGQVSFPGGRMEESDPDVRAAALRETREEVGIDPQHVAVIGYLGAMGTLTGYAVTPVVGLVSEQAQVIVDPTEVEMAFEVPLEFLLERGNQRSAQRRLFGHSLPMIEFHYEDQKIWGATAQMILSLRKIVL